MRKWVITAIFVAAIAVVAFAHNDAADAGVELPAATESSASGDTIVQQNEMLEAQQDDASRR